MSLELTQLSVISQLVSIRLGIICCHRLLALREGCLKLSYRFPDAGFIPLQPIAASKYSPSLLCSGGVVVPSAVLGVLTGAIMMRQFRPTISQALLAACGSVVATMATTLVLMLGLSCATNQMAGVTATYDGTR